MIQEFEDFKDRKIQINGDFGRVFGIQLQVDYNKMNGITIPEDNDQRMIFLEETLDKKDLYLSNNLKSEFTKFLQYFFDKNLKYSGYVYSESFVNEFLNNFLDGIDEENNIILNNLTLDQCLLLETILKMVDINTKKIKMDNVGQILKCDDEKSLKKLVKILD